MIPPLVSYPSIDAFLNASKTLYARKERKSELLSRTIEDIQTEASRLWDSGLPPIATPRLLSLLLGVSPRLIPRMIAAPAKYWREFQLPKKSGGSRTIVAPRVFLKTIQLFILQNILSKTEASPYAFGFSKRKGTVACAELHRKHAWLCRFDIRDFFGSVKQSTVSALFKDLGFNPEVAAVLANLCTLQGSLPQGAPTSPYIADRIFVRADHELAHLAALNNMTYSRYADDMIFSGSDRPPFGFEFSVLRILEGFGFSLNHGKSRLFGPNESHQILGLVVNEKVHPSREVRRMLRAKFHNLEHGEREEGESTATTYGWASYANSYDLKLGARYLGLARHSSLDPIA